MLGGGAEPVTLLICDWKDVEDDAHTLDQRRGLDCETVSPDVEAVNFGQCGS